nr:hypothetical protein CFP56_02883 [Quercus suber]
MLVVVLTLVVAEVVSVVDVDVAVLIVVTVTVVVASGLEAVENVVMVVVLVEGGGLGIEDRRFFALTDRFSLRGSCMDRLRLLSVPPPFCTTEGTDMTGVKPATVEIVAPVTVLVITVVPPSTVRGTASARCQST